MGDRIVITERETLEIRIMIGIGVGNIRDKIETEVVIEALVTIDQDQVREQLQIGIALDVSSVGSMNISQETVQQHRQTEK